MLYTMRSHWILCALTGFALLQQVALRREKNVDRCNLNIKIFPYARSLCEPLGSVWVMRNGRCIMGLTCTKGYTEEECKKHCSTKATTVSAKTAINSQGGSSIRTRRPRTTEAMQIKR